MAKAGKKTVPATPVRLAGAWALGKRALAELKRHWKLYLAIVALVEVPTYLATTYLGVTSGSDTQAYLALAGVFMEVALIYAVLSYRRGAQVSLREAYYTGSHAILRFIIVVVMLAVMLLPLVIASDIYGVSFSSTTPVGSGELILLGAVSLILALPSFWLLGRTILAILAVVDEDIRPAAAIRLAWGATRHRYWRVIGRLLAIIVWLVPVLILPVIIFGGLYALVANVVFIVLLQLSIGLLALPFAIIYGVGLYDELQNVPARGK